MKKKSFKKLGSLKAPQKRSFKLVGGPYAGHTALLSTDETFKFSANGCAVGRYVSSGERTMIWKEDES